MRDEAERIVRGQSCIDWKDYIRPIYKGMKVLVTGACGSIGHALVVELKAAGAKVSGIDHNEYAVSLNPWCILGDFTEMPQIDDYEVVFHAAAYKHVDLGERNVRAFYVNNELKTKRFLDRIQDEAPKAKFVLVSTDKAAGDSIMGQSKRACETMMLNQSQWALRLVNCAWSRGSVLERWKDDLLPWSGPTTIKRYFMQLGDAAQALLRVPFLPPGLYSVYGLPMVSVGELRKAFCKIVRKTTFEDRPARKGEIEEEQLIRDKEWLSTTSYPHISRVETCKDLKCPVNVANG